MSIGNTLRRYRPTCSASRILIYQYPLKRLEIRTTKPPGKGAFPPLEAIQ